MSLKNVDLESDRQKDLLEELINSEGTDKLEAVQNLSGLLNSIGLDVLGFIEPKNKTSKELDFTPVIQEQNTVYTIPTESYSLHDLVNYLNEHLSNRGFREALDVV